jgi:SpoVK/Ycf46/Vps4 family AAA+-type ATPase
MNNESLSGFFDEAARNAPSLLIFEDLDRAFVVRDDPDQRPRITLQHFLNCLDGVGTQDGLIVVATANDPSKLDAAILKRPGRFDRVIPFRPPNSDLRADYLHRLTRGTFGNEALKAVAAMSDGLSFAQLRESYILAGQLAFESDTPVSMEQLRNGIDSIRRQITAVKWADGSKVGFDICDGDDHTGDPPEVTRIRSLT